MSREDTLKHRRRCAASEALSLYDKGDMTIDFCSGWGLDGDVATRFVVCGQTELFFVVKFEPGSSEVVDAYFA